MVHLITMLIIDEKAEYAPKCPKLWNHNVKKYSLRWLLRIGNATLGGWGVGADDVTDEGVAQSVSGQSSIPVGRGMACH